MYFRSIKDVSNLWVHHRHGCTNAYLIMYVPPFPQHKIEFLLNYIKRALTIAK